MASRKLEERLDQLKQLRGSTPGPDLDAVLAKALADRSNLVVAEAAKAIAAHHRTALIPQMLEALDRLFDDPVKTDPKCWGKTAIVKTLVALEYSESPRFVRGLGHVQMEPVWGGQEDAAILFRSNCVLALVQGTDLGRPEIFRHLVDALADPEYPVRIEVVRALEQLNGEEAILLLRLKAYAGDRESPVIGQVFDSLLNLESGRGVPFVAKFMENKNAEIRDEAALALGGSRLPGAIEVLMETWRTRSRDAAFRSVLLRALSSSRHDTALEFLLGLVKTGITRDATAALEALELHKDSPEIQQLVEEAKNWGRS